MSGTTFRESGTLITHNNAAYIPVSLMPGYTGHVPTTKFQYGVTFGNGTVKYFLDSRCAAMIPSTGQYGSGGMFPSICSRTGGLLTNQHSWNRDSPYWARYNIDFQRQEEIKHFNELAQIHRKNYKDKTGTLQPVSYFTIPVKEREKYSQEAIDFLPMKKMRSAAVRPYQTLPSGIRTSVDDRLRRDVFFERR